MLIKRLLKRINDLTILSEEGILQFLSCAEQIELQKGDCLLDNGQICNYLYFVESGFLRTYTIKDGEDINIDFTFEGSFTSNLKSLKKNQPSHLIIETGESSIISLFNKDNLLELYAQSTEIELLCRKILGILALESNEHLEFYKINTPTERYRFLIENKPQMIQRLSQSQLSSYIGVARETLSRIRKRKT